MTDIKRGDRVRVTTEVEILNPEKVRVHTLGNGGVYGYRALFQGIEVVVPADATIEKIEPPVEVFKPGDVVRHKRNPKLVYAVTDENGWVPLHGIYGEAGSVAYVKAASSFTSENYEKVDLG